MPSPPRRPKNLAGTSALLFPRDPDKPEDFSHSWPHGLNPPPDERTVRQSIAQEHPAFRYDAASGRLGQDHYEPSNRTMAFRPVDPGFERFLEDKSLDRDSTVRQPLPSAEDLGMEHVSRPVSTNAVQVDPAALNGLLRRIAIGEGTDDEAARTRRYTVGGQQTNFASGYDVPFGDGRFAAPDKPLTQMSFREIYALQDRMAANPANKGKSTPVGKYQFRKATLKELQRRLGIDENAKFDAAMQDTLARARLEQRGLSKYVAGTIDGSQFQANLHPEWASIVDPKTGRVGPGQHLGTTSSELQAVLRPLRPRSN